MKLSVVAAVLVMRGLAFAGDPGEGLYYEEDYAGAYEVYGERLRESTRYRDELEYAAGTAAFKAQNFPQAAEHLGRAILAEDESLRAKAYYNLGNTLFRLGQASEEKEEIEAQWEGAMEHYSEAEALGGGMERSARHNREIVEKYLADLRQEEPPQQNDEQNQDQDQQGDQGQDQKQEGQDQKQEGQDQKQEGQDQKQEGQDGNEDEQQSGDQQQGEEGQQQEGQQQEGQQQEGQQQEGQQQEGQQQEGQQQEGQQQEGQQQDSASADPKEGERLGEKEGQQGEVQADQKGEPSDDAPRQPSAYELTPDGKLSEAAARALLESLEGEEVKAPYEIRRSKHRQRVLRDW